MIKKQSYDFFAKQYSNSMDEDGDYFHKYQIDPFIYKIIGNVKRKNVYDLGCGNGYISRKLAKDGAKVYSSDISVELLKLAEVKSEGLNISFSTREATDFSGLNKNYFDVVIMNMVIQYIDNIEQLFAGIASILKKGGKFVFSTDHFLKPAEPYSFWEIGKFNNKDALFSKITGYLAKSVRHPVSPWDNQTKLTIYKRPLGEFINKLSKNGLMVTNLYEPETPEFPKGYSPEITKKHLIPTFMVIGTIKN